MSFAGALDLARTLAAGASGGGFFEGCASSGEAGLFDLLFALGGLCAVLDAAVSVAPFIAPSVAASLIAFIAAAGGGGGGLLLDDDDASTSSLDPLGLLCFLGLFRLDSC